MFSPKKLSILFASLLIGSLLFSGVANALILQADDEIFFNEFATEDVYLAGGNITIQQDIEGDLVIAGGNVTLNSVVNGDLWIAGGNVIVNSGVRDDLRMIGGALSLNDNVDGDVVLVGGNADINKEVVIAGDLVVVAGAVNLYGTVNRSVKGILGRIVIGGDVNGDVDVRVTEKLVLLNSGYVAGNVTYFAPEKIEDHGGIIDGEISFNEVLSGTEKVKEGVQKIFNRGYFMGKLWSYLSLFLIGFFMILLFPHLLHRSSEQLKQQTFKSFGTGFLIFVLAGVASLISVFTIIGVQLAFIVMSLLFVLGELGRVATAYWLGTYVIRHDDPKKGTSKRKVLGVHLAVLAVGLLIVKLIGMIPFVGWIAGFFFFLVGAGALFTVQRATYRQLVKDKVL